MIRVELPGHLRTLAGIQGEVQLEAAAPVTPRTVLDALEARYPTLRGTIRDHLSGERRSFLRFFACEEDFSHLGMDVLLPAAVVDGREAFLVIGAVAGGSATIPAAETLATIHTESGANLLALAEASPVLLVFLRHFGCSFCRQAISDVADLKSQLAARGVRPVFVHLGPSELAKVYFEYYGIGDVERIHDPHAVIYQLPIFRLSRINPIWHLVNPRVWAGWLSGAVFKHGIGMIQGDGSQMPGVFFLRDAQIVRGFIHKSISDRPNYLKLIA
jgi:hypothetical protein